MSRSVRFLTRAGCRLCDAAMPLVARRASRKGWSLEVIDVDRSGAADEFGDRVPVVMLDGIEVLSGRFGSREVRRKLR